MFGSKLINGIIGRVQRFRFTNPVQQLLDIPAVPEAPKFNKNQKRERNAYVTLIDQALRAKRINRSKYQPHEGAKQRAKAAARAGRAA